MPLPLSIIIVDKLGSLKSLTVKDYCESELYKKCGFKKSEDFTVQHEWLVKMDGRRYLVALYGKLEGKANMENKYDFPPPVDKELYFGSCALVGMIRDESNNRTPINLTLDLWNKIYEKLFGGFEDLTITNIDDEDEEDELDAIPVSQKTKKGGYLKDGFVVDSSDLDEDELSTESSDEGTNDELLEELDDGIELEDIGSELSEESYE